MAQDSTQANASDLLDKAQRSLAATVAAAQKDRSLNLEVSKSKPFWDGLKDVGKNIDNSKRDLDNKDNRFFASLSSATAGFVQAEIALLMAGGTTPDVTANMNSLGQILQTLNENFSKEAARLKQGGELTASEKQQLDKLIAQQDELLRKLEQVEKNVAQNNSEMQAAIAKMKQESKKIRHSGSTVGGFVGGFLAAHVIYDRLWGWHWWWGPWGGWCPGYIDIGIIVWDDWADEVIYDWALTEAYVDIADLELTLMDLDDAELAANLDYLDENDFSFDGDIDALTDEIDHGWDDVSTDTGEEIVDQIEDNLDVSSIYDVEATIETFEDYGVDDFGDDMGSMDFDDDW